MGPAFDNSMSKSHNPMRLLDLPEECILMMLSCLDLPALTICCLVSKELYRLVRDRSLWRGLFIERPVTEGTPSPRLWSSSAVLKDRMFIYGGHTTQGLTNLISNVKSDLFEFDFATRKWTQLEHSMGGKTEHKCVEYDNALWFVGGYNGYDYTNDIYRFDPETRTSILIETTGELFSRRSALTAIVYKNKLYCFGGWNGFDRTWYNDLFEFDFESRHWKALHVKGDIPAQRTSHSAVRYGNCMYVFGGFTGDTYLNDLHKYNFETQTWTNMTYECTGDRPEPRSRFCAVVHGHSMYILGGWNKVGYFEDFYSFDFESNIWSKITNKNFEVPCLSQYSLCTYKDMIFIFGGFCAKEKQIVNRIYTYLLPTTTSFEAF